MNITEIITAAISLCALIVTALLIPVFKNRWGEEKYKKVVSKIDALVLCARPVVQAMEALFPGTGRGEEKLAEAMIRLTAIMAASGIVVDEKEIRVAIEAALADIKKEINASK